MEIFSGIPLVLGQILLFIYNSMAFTNYGLAIILFTLFIRAILMPLTVKQYSSTLKMQEFQPQIQEIQKRYKSDKEKLNKELMEFYKTNNFNPAGGCLPMFIQLPILFSLMYVIGKPLTYMLGMSADKIAELVGKVPVESAIGGFYSEIGAVGFHHLLNMNFLGLNLGLVPSYHWDKLTGPMGLQYGFLLLIPIVATLTTYLSIKYSMATRKPSASTTDISASMQKNMMLIGPIMTLMVSFQFPAGLGLYWAVGSLVQIVQQMVMNRRFMEKEVVASK